MKQKQGTREWWLEYLQWAWILNIVLVCEYMHLPNLSEARRPSLSHLRVMTWTIHLVALVSVSPRELRRTQLQLLSCSSHSFRQVLHVTLEEHSRCAWWLQKSKVGRMAPRLIDSRREHHSQGHLLGRIFFFPPSPCFCLKVTVTQEEWEPAIQESFLLNYALEWKQFPETRFHVEGSLFP